MKNVIIEIVSAKGIIVNYLFYKEDKRKSLFDYQHKARIKQIIFGEVFTYYHKEMDFTHALNSGCKILTDNRK